jgi:hypothetical protein
MLGQLEYQAQEITEKIGQLKALQEEMERKEQLFEECSRQLQVMLLELEGGGGEGLEKL